MPADPSTRQPDARAPGERLGAVRFCLAFAALTVAVFAVLYAAQATAVAALNRHLAWLAAIALGALGAHVSAAGPILSARGFAVEVKNNCNAVYEAGLFAAAVWAYPATIRSKALGTLAGVSILYAVNVLRLVSLLAIGALARDWFDVAHLYVWQALFFAVVAGCWFGWVLRVSARA